MTIQDNPPQQYSLPSEHQNLFSGINEFFNRNSIEEATAFLWSIAITSLGNKDADNWDHIERSDMLSFLRDVDNLIKTNLKIFRLENGIEKDDG